jgi:hypothetical protein
MLSRQLRFYTLGSDAQIVWDALRAIDSSFVCFENRRPVGSDEIVPCDPVTGATWQIAIASAHRINDLVWMKAGTIEVVDVDPSPVVEWSRSLVSNGALRKGRLYMKSHYFSDEGKTRKDEEFIAKSARMFNAVKRKFSRFEDLDGYFGPEARLWVLSMDQPREVSNSIVPASQVEEFIEQETRLTGEALQLLAKRWNEGLT